MRLTLSLILIAAATLYGASYIQAAKSAEATAGPPVTRAEGGAVARARLKVEAERRDAAERRREARTGRLTRSICVGCGGPVLPFDPSGGAEARRAAARPAGPGRAGR